MSAPQPLELDTPVRTGGRTPDAAGYTLLRDVGSAYRDGAEQALLELVRRTDDLGSLNEELHRSGTSWAEQYHVDRRRANVLRAFEVGRARRVLEIGAGCGAVSRYLAEECALVDALEPVPARAAVAAERLRDLPHARVFVGELADLPEEPSYDLIVVIGVLEYVAGGSADQAPYVEFLQQIRRRLLPGGSLLLAIENKLGVKYLAGSPEDHTDRPFDSLEDYPVGSPARTFDRQALADLFEQAGLSPGFFAAFPDYKMTRTVIADSLLGHPSELATRLPRFPSPDWVTQRDLGPNEELLWRTLVAAGQGGQHGNSFVVLAGVADQPAEEFWPADRAGAYFSTERRPGRATQTVITEERGSLQVTRTALGQLEDAGEFSHRLVSGPVVPGRPLDDVLAGADVEYTARMLTRWVQRLEATAGDADGVALDLVPHNLLLDGDELVFIDDEWRSRSWSAEHVVARGLIWLSHRLATIPCHWHDRPSRRALLTELAGMVGVRADDAWLAEAVAREAHLQVQLFRLGADEPGYAEEVERTRGELSDLLELPLVPVRHSTLDLFLERERDRRRITELHDRCIELDVDRNALRADRDRLAYEVGQVREELAAVHGSRSHRLIGRYQQGVERLAPNGTVRRRVYDRVGQFVETRARG